MTFTYNYKTNNNPVRMSKVFVLPGLWKQDCLNQNAHPILYEDNIPSYFLTTLNLNSNLSTLC